MNTLVHRSPPRERRDRRSPHPRPIPVLPHRATALIVAFSLFALIAAVATPASAAIPAARMLALHGTITNTTADISANARLVLTIDGENVTAVLKTEAPLSGSGQLAGRLRNGWLELAGKVDEGFQLHLRGALNPRDFRGTYIAAVPDTPVQYGKFQLAVEPK